MPSAGPGKIIPGPKPAAGAEESRPGTGQPPETAQSGSISSRAPPERHLAFAAATAAVVCARRGAYAPTRGEVDQVLAAGRA